MTRRLWPALFLLLILLLAAEARGLLLIKTERYLDADESVVGLMARHIRDRGEHPAFFYGQHYGGGHSLSAHVVAAIGKFRKIDAFTVQLVPALFSLGIIAAAWRFGTLFAPWPAAFVGTALLAFEPAFLKSSLKADGYMETLFTALLCATLFFSRVRPALERGALGARGFAALAGCAFLAGVAFWCYEFSAPMIVLLLLFAAPFGRRFFLPALAALPFFALGAAPLIADNFAHDFLNLKHLLGVDAARAATQAGAGFFHKLITAAVRDFPAFFGADAVHNWADPVPPHSYSFALAAVAAWLLGWRTAVTAAVRKGRSAAAAKFAFLFPPVYFLVYAVSPFAGVSPRYLLPLEPMFSLAAGAGIAMLIGSRRALPVCAAVALTAGLIFGAARGGMEIFSDDAVVEGNVPTHGEDLERVAAFLEERPDPGVYTTYFIKWRLLFESDERLAAANMLARPGGQGWTKYEETLADAPTYAYVFHRQSPWLGRLLELASIRGVQYNGARIGDYYVVFDLDPQIRAEELTGVAAK